MWMIKDNHKRFFGGIRPALDFFKNMQGFYTPIEVEVHNLEELKIAINCNVKHVMLDNFSPAEVVEAISYKPKNITYEISGGIKLDNIDEYFIKGIDAISVGALTYAPPSVDISFKYHKIGD